MKFGIFYEHQLPRSWKDGSGTITSGKSSIEAALARREPARKAPQDDIIYPSTSIF